MTTNVSRTAMSIRNASATFFNRGLALVLNFIGRTVFLQCLSAEYLGLSGLFGNIFSVLALIELGFGAAITQSLYSPMAKGDEYEVCRIMNYFNKVYSVVAFVTAVCGIAVMPFLDTLVGHGEIPHIKIVYILFLFHSVVSYLFAPKRTLIVCDQRLYLVTLLRTVFSVVILLFQILVLKTTKDYCLYIAVRIFFLSVEGFITDTYAQKKYTFLDRKLYVSKEYKINIFKKVKALILHKFGAIMNNSTDSILISYFLGLECMGMYSNYALIITSVGTLIDIVMSSVSASVGNLGATSDKRNSEHVMKELYFLNFWLLTCCSCVLVSCVNKFILLWLGEKMLFGNVFLFVVVSCFYFSCIRDPVQIFLQAYGIFSPTKFINPARAGVNIAVSCLLIKRLGIIGVFAGTLVSTLSVPLWCEVRMLYKYGFKMGAKNFVREMCGYILCSYGLMVLCFFVTQGFASTLSGTFLSALVSFLLSNAIVFLLYSKSVYFGAVGKLFKRATTAFFAG